MAGIQKGRILNINGQNINGLVQGIPWALRIHFQAPSVNRKIRLGATVKAFLRYVAKVAEHGQLFCTGVEVRGSIADRYK